MTKSRIDLVVRYLLTRSDVAGQVIAAGELRAAFLEWAGERGEVALSAVSFGFVTARCGLYERVKSSRHSYLRTALVAPLEVIPVRARRAVPSTSIRGELGELRRRVAALEALRGG